MATSIQIPEYELLEEITQGHSATIYKAKHHTTAHLSAIKVCHDRSRCRLLLDSIANEQPTSPISRNNELELLASVAFPGIVKLLGFGASHPCGCTYLALEFLDGVHIDIAARHASKSGLLQILLELTQVLDFLHRRELLHGDIKPANVMVLCAQANSLPSHSVRLIDFGGAHHFRQAPSASSTFGTPGYLAPELMSGGAHSVSTDLYAFGATLFTIITGGPPHPAGQLDDPRILPTPSSGFESTSALDRDLLILAHRLLAHSPGDRPSSAMEVIRQLRTLAAQHEVTLRLLDYSEYISSCPRVATRPVHTGLFQAIEHTLHNPEPSPPHWFLIGGPRGSGKSALLLDAVISLHLHGRRTRMFAGTGALIRLAHFLDTHSVSTSTRSSVDVLAWDLSIEDCTGDLSRIISQLTRVPGVRALILTVPDGLAPSYDDCGLPRLKDYPDRHHSFHLAPLTSSEVTAGLKAMLGVDTVPAELVRHVMAVTEGNAFASWTLLAAMLASQHVLVEGARLSMPLGIPSLGLPTALLSWYGRIIETLPIPLLPLVRYLALSAFPLSGDSVASLLGKTTEAIDKPLRLLLSRGVVLQMSCPGGLTYKVAGSLASSALLQGTNSDALIRYHQTLAYSFDRDNASAEEQAAAGTHYEACMAGEKAFAAFTRAAHLALSRPDYQLAIDYYRRASQLGTTSDERAAEVRLALARCLISGGSPAQSQVVLDTLHSFHGLSAPLEGRILLVRATCAFMLGHFDESATISRNALTHARRHLLTDNEIEAMKHLGSALCWKERRATGSHLLLRALRKARSAHRLHLALGALRDIASSNWKAGRYRLAYLYELRRLRLTDARLAPLDAAYAFINLGIVLQDLGNYRQGRSHHRRAGSIAKERSQPALLGAVHINIGETYRSQGSWREAVKSNLMALDCFRQSGEFHHAAVGTSNLARAFTNTGFPMSGASLLRHQLASRVPRDSVYLRTMFLVSWATLLRAFGAHRLSYRILSQAREIAYRHHLRHLTLEILTLMALNMCALGEASGASDQIEGTLGKLMGHSPYDMQLFAELAKIQIHLKANRLGIAAEQDLELVIARTRKRRNLWHLTWGLLIRAELLLGLSRGAEAEAGVREAIDIARRNADRTTGWKAQYWLGRVFEQGLRYEQALRAYRVAALTIEEIAADIDVPRWKQSYLNQAEVSDALSRHARLKGEVGRRARRDVARLNRSEMVSRKMLASLSAIGQQLSSILEMDRLLSNILDLSIDNVGAERGVIFLVEKNGQTMTAASARGVGGENLEDLSSFSQSVLAQAAQGKTILTVDVGQDPSLANHPSLVIHEIKSILCIPMRNRGRVLGVLYLDTRKAHQLFTDKERSFVESFASQAAIAIENARLFGEMRAENHRLHEEVEGRFRELVGGSPSMRRLGDTIGSILNADCTVLLTGESGTGKEVVARVIHYNSPRRKGPFVAIDCGALPENLLEAELFGCRRGAFTGADRDRIGLIEAANGGSLFLDEITNTSTALQARLLRVLQEREIRRLGENNNRRVDVRFMAATNADIESLIREGRFRQDLYYRLNVVNIPIPPLRDRLEDIPLLVEHILARRASNGQTRARLGPGVLRLLMRHTWPGNVRELENVLERACVLSAGGLVTMSALPDALRFSEAGEPTGDGRFAMTPAGVQPPQTASRKTGEQAMIEDALRRFGGDKVKAARYIGWNRQKLYRRMKAYAIATKFGRAA